MTISIDLLKSRYAYESLKVRASDNDFLKAIYEMLAEYGESDLFPEASSGWNNDPWVISERTRFKAELGELHFLPSRADLAKTLWEKAHGRYTEPKDFAIITKLYAEVMDMTPRSPKLAEKVEKIAGVTVVASKLDEDI